MLDTNIVSDLLRNPDGNAARRIADVSQDAICVSIITAGELRYGCARKGSAKLLAHVEAILESVQVLAFDVPADMEYGRIRAELETAGTPIGPNDLLIAAHAYAAGAILVTDNSGEFSRVTGLRVENWIR
jgi:tRNA(fMet)-specific endonuclease VapC